MNQKILVFETKILDSLGYFKGFTLDVEKYLPTILNHRNNQFIEREEAENNINFKQVISYVMLRYDGMLFSYIRGKQAEEERLIGKRSIGLGGHIEQIDKRYSSSTRDLYINAAQRELAEEVIIESSYKTHIVALINNDLTEVDKVHFGILHIWDLFEPKVRKREQGITKIAFINISKLKHLYDELETWSQIALSVIEDPRTPTYLENRDLY